MNVFNELVHQVYTKCISSVYQVYKNCISSYQVYSSVYQVWSRLIMLDQFDHVWWCLIMFDHVWSSLIKLYHVLSCLNGLNCHISSNLKKFLKWFLIIFNNFHNIRIVRRLAIKNKTRVIEQISPQCKNSLLEKN